MSNTTQNAVAGGTIQTARFVKTDTSNDFRVLQCGDNEVSIGVSQLAGRTAPIPDVSSPIPAANEGEALDILPPGTQGYITAGEALANGVYVKSDANGKAVALDETAGTEENVAGYTLETASAADETIKIRILQQVKTTET